MKKVFAIALAIIMTLSVVLGCSGKKETPPAKSTAVTQQQQKENGKVSSSAEKDKQNKQEKKAYNQNANNGQVAPASNTEARVSVEKGKSYTDKEHVAAYIHLYKTLPPMPDKQGRTWKECDIDYVRGNRNAKRICFSNDGLVYYTSTHYQKFERLY